VVRSLLKADVEVCARIIAGDPLWQRYGLTLPRARTAIRSALAPRGDHRRPVGEFAVAEQVGQVVGFIWFRTEGTFHHSGYVRWVAVAPEARSRGIGRVLMQHAEHRILEQGPNVFLLVSDFNRRARAFYRNRGYTRVGALPDYVVPGITEHLLRKTRGPIARPGGERRSRTRGQVR
jgi:ribosomal protein S18 acetylase RimI-like enzyme